MKVLVFDDKPANRTAAEVTLKGHELTVAATYDEAQAALVPKTDYERARKMLDEKFGDYTPWKDESKNEEKRAAYFRAQNEFNEACTTYPDFDAVLTDLMVKPSGQALANKWAFANQEMPLGTTIALLAITQGIKKVAVVTDLNHHKHPASAAFDCFRGASKDEIKVICTNRVNYAYIDEKTMEIVDENYLRTPEGKVKYGDYDCRRGLITGKNWGQILDWLNE